MADQLVELVDASGAELWHTPGGEAFVSLRREGHREHRMLRSKSVRRWLSFKAYEALEKAPASEALQSALGVLEGRALYEGPEHEAHVRLAGDAGAVYLDLGDRDWRAVRIDGSGWEVVHDPPVRFRRAAGQLALPEPVAGGSVDELRGVLNGGLDRASWRLIVGWLIGAIRPSGPYLILVLFGEQGSGKSTAVKLLRNLLDPNEAAVRAAPREERDLQIAASNGRVVALDNLSSLSPELSDGLCRLATGTAFGTRTLYSDDDETLFSATRPVVLNGITELATRPDLMDRSIIVELPRISDHRREAEVLAEFERLRPPLLGALCDAVSRALANESTTRISSEVRMVDAATWVEASDIAPAGAFTDALVANRDSADERVLDEDVVAHAVVELVRSRPFVGTWSELLDQLNSRLDQRGERPPLGWPKSPRGLSGAVRRLAPVLRRSGLETEVDVDVGKGSERHRALCIRVMEP